MRLRRCAGMGDVVGGWHEKVVAVKVDLFIVQQ
jgi:hypothetical protein